MTHFGGESFGQKLPPLYKVIQSILQDYPCGQIFKEIIQNADDARAAEVKFFLDYRNIHTLPKSLVDLKCHSELDKYYGNALIAFNDAPFTAKDWDGIQSLQDSSKAADPHRVGKFGLGFNSVYHITDLPVILSEEYCAFLDPHQVIWDGKPGQRYTLTTLQDIEPHFIKIFSPFGHCFAKRFHKQTIFRFPLRKSASKMSSEIFSMERLEQLVHVLQSEARYLLLFLRSVQSIEVIRIRHQGVQEQVFKVSMKMTDRLEMQNSFFDKMALNVPRNVISYKAHVTIQIEPSNSKYEWVIVHHTGSKDEEVLKLANQQCVVPWISTACELSDLQDPGGHLFCSLPMPTEERAPFKVSVNGTFAVCSNRRSFKWEEQERQLDDEGMWNKYLVEKCLPYCYVEMMHFLMTCIHHEYVYSYYPSVSMIQGTPWEGLLRPFYSTLFATSLVLYTPVYCGQWIGIDRAVMLMKDEKRPKAVERVLVQLQIPFVNIPQVILEAEKYSKFKFIRVTPNFVKQKLKVFSNDIPLVYDDKIGILEYCLNDECYTDLIGLNLLPLANGTFGCFSCFSSAKEPPKKVFLTSEEIPHTLLPNMSHRFVNTSCLYSKLKKLLITLAKSKSTQLSEICEAYIAQLLVPSQAHLWPNDQLEKFWFWLQQGHTLKHFEGCHIIPVEEEYENKALEKNEVIYVPEMTSCSQQLASALTKYQLLLVRNSNFPFLKHNNLSKYLRHLTPSDILAAIEEQQQDVSFTVKEANELQHFLIQDYYAVQDNIKTISKIPMFYTIQNTLCSLNDVQNSQTQVIVEDTDYNIGELVPLNPVVLSCSKNNKMLLMFVNHLVTAKTKIDYFVEFIFPAINNRIFWSKSKITNVMKEALLLISSCTHNEHPNYLAAIKQVRFLDTGSPLKLYCIPELIDPTDISLLALYKGQDVFPPQPFNSYPYIDLLRQCGLKTSDQITGEDVATIIMSLIKQVPDITAHERACALINFIDSSTTDIFESFFKIHRNIQSLSSFIRSVKDDSWVPVYDKPPTQLYRRTKGKLHWKGTFYHLAPPNVVVILDEPFNESILPWIMGSSVCFMKSVKTPSQLRHLLSHSTLIDKLLEHFKHVIQTSQHLSNDTLSYISNLTYEYLSNNGCNVSDCITLKEWIWIDSESCFVSPSATAFNNHPSFQHSFVPFVHILPSHYREHYHDLFFSCGTEENVTDDQIVSILFKLQSNKLLSSDQKVTLAVSILEWMVTESIDVSNVLIPIQSDTFDMLSVSKVLYPISDSIRCLPTSTDCKLVHSQINKDLAKKLQIKTLESYLGISQDIISEDVGPHMSLLDQLKNILKQYQDTDGYTVVKEMLQNADDAGATEINILFDSRQHTKSGLYYKGMAKAHGPALVIHNNKQFSKEDFINITKVAASYKGKEGSLKIGKFGLGFCSVYHITDIPSFISTDQLYIFDPTLSYLSDHIQDRSQPGQKANFTTQFLRTQTSPFYSLFGFKTNKSFSGTIFRLPFRTTPSELSSKCYDPINYFKMLHDRLEKDGSKLLLFLRNVNKMTLYEIDDFDTTIQTKLIIHRSSEPRLHISPSQDLVTITSNKSKETWLVCSSQKWNDKDFSTASVACKINHTLKEVEKCEGEIFCFLPLGFIKTGLPVHVSANFAITTNRRGIWMSDSLVPEEKEVLWNRDLMSESISKAYYLLLCTLQKFSNSEFIKNYSFYLLWPLYSELKNKNPWSMLVINLYKLIAMENHGLLQTIGSGKWLTLHQSKILYGPILCSHVTGKKSATPSCVFDVLSMIKNEVIVVLPSKYINEIRPRFHVNFFNEMDFVKKFLKFVVTNLLSNIELRNKVLLCIFENFSYYLDDYDRKEVMLFESMLKTNQCLPCGSKGHVLRYCNEAVDSLSPLCILFTSEDNLFPHESFMKSPPCKRAITHLGLICKKLPHGLLSEAISKTSSVYASDPDMAIKRLNVVVDCLNLLEELPINSEIPKLCFVPVLKKPITFFLTWKGKECNTLLSPKQVMYGQKLPYLVGSQEFILDQNLLPKFSEKTAKLLGMVCEPNIDTVLNQLIHLIKKYKSLTKDGKMTEQHKKIVNEMYNDIVVFLEQVPGIEKHPYMIPLQVNTGHKEYATLSANISSVACIWTGHEFVLPSCVASNWKTVGPLLYSLPPVLSDKLHLIKAFGCQDSFGIPKLLSSLSSLYETYKNKPIPSMCQNVLREIITELDKNEEADYKTSGTELYLPDTCFRMQKVSDLVYRDVDWCDDSNSSISFVSPMVTASLAKTMGVFSTREKSLSLQQDEFAKFGQHEDLTVRINNIIRDYPLDVTFIKELVQNADDAGATKVVFIFDKRTHSNEKVFSENWKELQGPSLLVWNDSNFSESDLRGIQNLGFGGKRHDTNSETIGKFGIGFNVVYNITDCPSFITRMSKGQTLCILDPQCKYVPQASNLHPGGRYNDVDKNGGIWEKFEDIASTFSFKNVMGCSREFSQKVTKSGTLFRFPFRTEECFKTSKILHPELAENNDDGTKDEYTYNDDRIHITIDVFLTNMKKWINDIKMMLLFLTNLKCIEVYGIEDTAKSKIHCYFSCKNTLQDEGKRKEYREVCCNFKQTPSVVSYILDSKTKYCFSETERKCDEKWFIQQGIGNMNCLNKKWKHSPSLKPRHGIALRLHPPVKEHFQGKLFCFLPLPTCTDLPVHLNGQFILTSARRDLWTSSTTGTSDDNSIWNDDIIDALSSSYSIVLCKLTEPNNGLFLSQQYNDIKELTNDVTKYFWLFPTHRKVSPTQDSIVSVPSGVWEKFAHSVFKKLIHCNAKILPSVNITPSIFAKPAHSCMIEWSTLFNNMLTQNQSYFFFSTRTFKERLELESEKMSSVKEPLISSSDSSPTLERALKKIGMNINLAPFPVWKAFKAVDCILPKIDHHSVYQYCRQYCSDGLPCNLEKTKFKTLNTFITILEYVLTEEKDGKEFPIIARVPYIPSTWPHDSPFLLTADKQLRCFDKNNPVISCEFISLFSKSLSHFLHHKLITLNMSSSYFYNHMEHGKSLLMNVIAETLPKCLISNDPVEREYLHSSNIYQYLKCFHSRIFKPIRDNIFSKWALIPSQTMLFVKPCDENKCLLPFVYLPESSDGQNNEMDKEIVTVLKQINMPFLDTTVFQYPLTNEDGTIGMQTNTSLIETLGCPNINEPTEILQNLLICQEKGFVHSFSNLPEILYKYFGQLNFKDSCNNLMIRSLPLFRTINGTLSPLIEEVYVWPNEVPVSGVSQQTCNWLSVTFLCANGEWTNFGDKEALGIEHLKVELLYVRYIFQIFHLMCDNDRIQHLEFIRDNLLDVCLAAVKHKENDSFEQRFIEECKNLPIISNKEGELCQANYFADHRKDIFNVFNGVFKLLPKNSCYRSDEWMEFLSKIGLKTELDEVMFVELCKAVESRDNTKYEDISQASRQLLDYLLYSCQVHTDVCPWPNPWEVLNRVADIKFVTLKHFTSLGNIAPLYIDNCIIVNDNCTLTALNGSAISKCANLIWTIKPIINIPLSADSVFFNNCNVTTDKKGITLKDVIMNLSNISRYSKFTDSELFDHYPYSPPVSLFKVIKANLIFLSSQSSSLQENDTRMLHAMKCIPVSVGDDSDKLVLVEPSTVVNHGKLDNLKPFLHCLPNKIKNCVPVPFLELIGIEPCISVKHCWKVLHDMYSYSKGQPTDVNTRKKLSIILRNLFQQLESGPCVTNDSLLYLPNIYHRLKPSTQLHYIDDNRFFSKPNEDFCTDSQVSIFRVHDSVDLERALCRVLPKTFRPLPLSLSCTWLLVPHCTSLNHTEFTQTLQRTVRHSLLPVTLDGILKSFHQNKPELMEMADAIYGYFKSYIFDADIVAKSSLQVSLYKDSTRICSFSVPYYVNQHKNTRSIYIDSRIGKFDSKFIVCLPMSSSIIRAALWKAELDCTIVLSELDLKIATLLEANEDEHFQAIIQHLQLEVDPFLQIESTMVFQPRLGTQVPSGLRNRFDDNREDAVFRYEEWVAYECPKNCYRFAQILHIAYREILEPRKYIIIINDEGSTIEVDVYSLYKFLPYIPENEDENSSDPYNIEQPNYTPNQNEGNRWLRQSEVDLMACRAVYNKMLEPNDCLAGHVCFLSHQVAEKVLKGVMYVLIGRTDLTCHRLEPLVSILQFTNPNDILKQCVSKAVKLDNYYIPTRCPNACRDDFPAKCYTVMEAEIAIANAEYLYTTLKEKYFVFEL